MTTRNSSAARFRSATDFPKSVTQLDSQAAGAVYEEMRECLIFTNRSRSQLLRRNEEHKQTIQKLKIDIEQMQALITQLASEKQLVVQDNRQIIASLEQQMLSMSQYLDQLSGDFDQIADVIDAPQGTWGFMATPSRFFKFLRAVKTVVLWWRDEKGEPPTVALPTKSEASLADSDEDRRNNPQMYDDPASNGRSLLDR